MMQSQRAPAIPRTRRRVVMIGLLALAYLYPFPYFPRIQNPNENVRMYMTVALVEEGTYAIDGPRARWGWVNDAAELNGRHYSVKGPATSLLGLPAYAVYWSANHGNPGWKPDRALTTWLLRVCGCVVPMLVFFWFLLPWLGRRTTSPVLRDAVWWSLAVGSCLYAYTLIFVSHAVAGAAGFGALMLLSRAAPQHGERPLGAPGFFAAGLLAAGVTALEYPGFPISAVLCVFGVVAARSWRRIAALCAGALAPVALVMHFQARAFGSPFTPGHLHMESRAFRAVHERGFFGADGFHADAASGMLLDPGFGMLPLTPILAAATLGVFVLLGRRRDRAAGIVAVLSALAAYGLACVLSNWRGGWTIGPRYLCWVYPMVGWAALAGLNALARVAPGIAHGYAVGATAVGVLASGLPSALYPHLPEKILRPLPQLFFVLLDGGFAPHTAANLADWTGWTTLLPLAVLGGVIIGSVALADARDPRRPSTGWRAVRWLTAPLVAAALGAAVTTVPDTLTAGQRAAARASAGFITENWTPPGRDLAARLETRDRAGRLGPAGRRRLLALYRAQGRDKLAAAVARRSRGGRVR